MGVIAIGEHIDDGLHEVGQTKEVSVLCHICAAFAKRSVI